MGSFRCRVGHPKEVDIAPASFGLVGQSINLSFTTTQTGQADFVIPNGTSSLTWNGNTARVPLTGGPARAVQPGDIIELEAGTHGQRTLQNINGSLNNRVIIRGPATGVATIRRNNPGGSGFIFRIQDSRHFTVDGESQTATPSTRDGKRRNIKVMYATNATSTNKDSQTGLIKFVSSNGATYTAPRNCTLRYLELDGGWPNFADQGSGIQTNTDSPALSYGWSTSPYTTGQYQEHITIEHCLIGNVYQEGAYVGENVYKWTRTNQVPSVPNRYMKIRYNYVYNSGGDGFVVKSWFDGTPGGDGSLENSVHDNILVSVGQNPNNSGVVGGEGISTSSAKCNIYNNWIETGGSHGIRFSVAEGSNVGDPNGTYTTRIYNNVILGAGSLNPGSASGINVRKESANLPASYPSATAFVYSNTILSSADHGIQFASVQGPSFARNNIVLQSTNANIDSGAGSQTSNLTTGSPSSIFVDPVGSIANNNINMRLLSAQLASGILGTDIATTDITGASRPGLSPDKGAYEFF